MDVTYGAGYSGRPYTLYLRVWTASVDVPNNRSSYNWRLYARSNSGYGSYVYNAYAWYVRIGNDYPSGSSSLVFGPSGDYAGKEITLGSGTSSWMTHDANGYLGFYIAGNHMNVSVFGSAAIGDTAVYPERIPKVPGTPGGPTASAVTTTSMTLSWTIPPDNGAGIDQMLLRYSTDPSMAVYTDVINAGNATSRNVAGLTPGTVYYWAVYAHNAVGYGPRSSILSQATIPATAPGLVVAPSLSGLSAGLVFSPPGGTSGVSKYNWEYRLLGSGSATPGSTLTTTALVEGLTAGATYEWRGNAEIGVYVSPWSAWTAYIQPNPNTNPGNYFDGSTAASPDQTYAWLSTVNNSASTATGRGITGWRTFAQGNATSGGVGVVVQSSGGFAGAFAARVTFTQDCTAAGFIAGVDVAGAATVEPGTTYYASLHVRLPARTQRLQSGIAWFTSANVLVGIDWGTAVVVAPSTTAWTRLEAHAISPLTATKCAPVVRDTTGTSWSLWLSGQQMWLDGAMVTLGQLFPYFDGATADTDQFDYSWLGAPNASASIRNILLTSPPDPLADPDCPPIPLPPTPPEIPSDCIVEVGTWRQYTVAIPASEVALWAATLPTLILETGSQAERQVRIRYFENPTGQAPESLDLTTGWVAELIITYMPPMTVMTMDGVTQRLRASVNGADPIVANQLLYGTNGVPATWPELRCGIGYVVTLDVPLEAPAGNLSTRVLVTQRV